MPEFHEVIDRPILYPMKAETKTLLAMLVGVEIGEVLTYESLGKAIGHDVRPVRGDANHLLQTARRRARDDHRVCFRAVPGIGLQRIDDIGKVEESSNQINKSRRASGRAVRMAVSVDDYQKLPKDRQIEHNRNLSIAGVLKHFTSDHGKKKIDAIVSSANAAVPVARSLEVFKDS